MRGAQARGRRDARASARGACKQTGCMQHTHPPRAPALARKGVLSSQPLQHQQHPFPPNAAQHRTRSMHLGGQRGRQRARDCSPASRIPRNPALALSLNLRPPARCPATRLTTPLSLSWKSDLPRFSAQFFLFFWKRFHRSNQNRASKASIFMPTSIVKRKRNIVPRASSTGLL